MKRKLFSILALLLMAVTGATAATITVTWNNFPTSGIVTSFTKDGITLTAESIDWEYSTIEATSVNGKFTSSIGNFKKIEITANSLSLGSGWTKSGKKATWTGNASTITFRASGYKSAIDELSSIVFTIDDGQSVAVTSVTLSPTTSSLTEGGAALELTPTVAPGDATDKTVKWSVVQDGSIVALYTDQACTQAVGTEALAAAKVYVKPLAAGQATVTVASNADASLKATCTVTVAAADPTYNVTFKEGTEDVGNWTIDPASAKQGQTVTVKYTGTKKMKSVKAVKKAKPAATVATAPTATADVKAGSETALVSGGTATGGTMMYLVTTENKKPTSTEGFSATVPTAKILAAGTVYVWYYVKADDTHTDSEISATAVTVTVQAAGKPVNAEGAEFDDYEDGVFTW